jgi:hypothetical protein
MGVERFVKFEEGSDQIPERRAFSKDALEVRFLQCVVVLGDELDRLFQIHGFIMHYFFKMTQVTIENTCNSFLKPYNEIKKIIGGRDE